MNPSSVESEQATLDAYLHGFYRAFEDRHRGSRELIKSRLTAYLPFLQPLKSLAKPSALDLGCGRGEWLELLGEQDIDALGVDLDQGMLAACNERGLHTKHADALQILRATASDSVALVSAFHLVEHLPFKNVQLLVREALRVLQPGGLLILETPNPENLVVGSSSFYMDPSHERPLPPQLLNFAVEYAGFARTTIMRLQEPAALRALLKMKHAEAGLGLSQVLKGVSPDYAVVAQKHGAALESFDVAFSDVHGITLDAVVQRYDLQGQQRHAGLQNLAGQLPPRVDQLAQQMLGTLEHMRYADHRLAQAEAQLLALTERVRALQSGLWWRLTVPLRLALRLARRARVLQREGQLTITVKRRSRALIARVALAALRQPLINRSLRGLAQRLPMLETGMRRLYNRILNSKVSVMRPPGVPVEQSPRAARMLHMLEQAGDTSAQQHTPPQS